MFKWLKKLMGISEKHKEVQHNIIPRVLIAPDADIISECKRRKEAQERHDKAVRDIERNMIHFYNMNEVKREADARKERQKQYVEWKENIRALDYMRQQTEVEQRRKSFKLVV